MKEKYLILRERKHLPSPVYWNIVYQTSLKTKKLYDIVLSKGWFHFNSGSHKLIFLKNEWNKKGEYIANKLLKDSKYFKRIKRRVNLEKNKTERFLKKIKNINFSKLTFKELINLGNKIKDRCLSYDSANVLAWFLGADKFQEKIYSLLNIPKEDFLILITPEEKTAVSQLEYKLLKYAKLVKSKKGNLEKLSQELANDYGWIPFDYDGPKYWKKDYFLKEIKKNFKHIEKTREKIKEIEKAERENLAKRKGIIKRYRLSKKDLDLVERAHTITLWTDERKKYTFQLYYWYSMVLWELEKRYNISFKNLKYLFTEELINTENNKDYLKKLSDKRIKKDFILKGEKGEITIISSKDKNEILKELKKQSKETEIKGQVACKGSKKKYIGRVKIILSPKQGNKLKKNEFLIATMTTPDYILLMKKAAGFITNEGGVTCHAAIVSREMNKPCIIGTKIATKVLKDGDLVEVDANKGIVKIIKKAE